MSKIDPVPSSKKLQDKLQRQISPTYHPGAAGRIGVRSFYTPEDLLAFAAATGRVSLRDYFSHYTETQTTKKIIMDFSRCAIPKDRSKYPTLTASKGPKKPVRPFVPEIKNTFLPSTKNPTRHEHALWTDQAPKQEPFEKSGARTSPSQRVFDHWLLYDDAGDFEPKKLATWPPANTRLSDLWLGRLILNNVSPTQRATMWPADFDSSGWIRPTRPPHGTAFYVVVNNQVYYGLVKDWYLLCGDEGVAGGLDFRFTEPKKLSSITDITYYQLARTTGGLPQVLAHFGISSTINAKGKTHPLIDSVSEGGEEEEERAEESERLVAGQLVRGAGMLPKQEAGVGTDTPATQGLASTAPPHSSYRPLHLTTQRPTSTAHQYRPYSPAGTTRSQRPGPPWTESIVHSGPYGGPFDAPRPHALPSEGDAYGLYGESFGPVPLHNQPPSYPYIPEPPHSQPGYYPHRPPPPPTWDWPGTYPDLHQPRPQHAPHMTQPNPATEQTGTPYPEDTSTTSNVTAERLRRVGDRVRTALDNSGTELETIRTNLRDMIDREHTEARRRIDATKHSLGQEIEALIQEAEGTASEGSWAESSRSKKRSRRG
ncbi:hypothetical protein MMC27_005104 [Xylographa pallens]|nr:hypothetical protein [Xylographa pallens]